MMHALELAARFTVMLAGLAGAGVLLAHGLGAASLLVLGVAVAAVLPWRSF